MAKYKYQIDEIYISKTDHIGRMFVWKCCRSGNKEYYIHRLLIEREGGLSYV